MNVVGGTEQQRAAVELSRQVVAELAPHELPLFPAVSRAFVQSGDRRPGRPADRELAFGAAEAVQMMSPVILAVVSGAVRFVVEEATKSLAEEGPDAVQNAAKALLDRVSGTGASDRADLVGLSREQVGTLRQMVFDHATSLKLTPEQAQVLADSVAGKLLLADK